MAVPGNAEIVLVYFVGTFGMMLLAGAIFFFFVTYQKRILKKELEINRIKTDQQDEILRNTVSSQEKERKRIAQDLHDEVGAMLSVVKLNVSRIEKKSEDNTTQELALETKNYLDDVITHVRRISRALMPPSLEKLGIYFAIEDLANWVNKSGQYEIECWKNGEPFRFNHKKELAVFRIIQELLNNSIKHSRATHIVIKMRFWNESIAVSLADNGTGFEPDTLKQSGLGLRNLKSRSQLLDAMFKVKSAPGKGTAAILFLKTTN